MENAAIHNRSRHQQLCLTLLLLFFSSREIVVADIFFASRTMGPSTNIYSVNYNGRLTRLTDDNRWRDTDASVAANGDITFISNRSESTSVDLLKHSEQFYVFERISGTGKVHQLTQETEFEHSPTYSPDGNWIAYIRKSRNTHHLLLFDRKTKSQKIVHSSTAIATIDWHPDSTRIIYTTQAKSDSAIQTVNVVTGEKVSLIESSEIKLIPEGKAILLSAQLSPDAKMLAYISSIPGEPLRRLHVRDLARKTDTLISDVTTQVQYPVNWGKSSDKLVYAALVDYAFHYDEKSFEKVYKGSMQIFLSHLKGNARQLTEGNFLHNRPVFSPGENVIAFLYGENLGKRELALHTLNLQTKERRALHNRVAGNSFLIWH